MHVDHDVAWFMATYGWNIVWTVLLAAWLIGRKHG